MFHIVHVFKVRVIYKGGAIMDFETEQFDATRNGGGLSSITWNCNNFRKKPIFIGLDDIAAVYQLGYRRALRFGRKK